MRRTHYELGVRVRRRGFVGHWRDRGTVLAAAVVVVLGVAGFAANAGYIDLPGQGATGRSELSHRDNRIKTKASKSKLSRAEHAARRAQRLAVKQAEVTVPSASPTAQSAAAAQAAAANPAANTAGGAPEHIAAQAPGSDQGVQTEMNTSMDTTEQLQVAEGASASDDGAARAQGGGSVATTSADSGGTPGAPQAPPADAGTPPAANTETVSGAPAAAAPQVTVAAPPPAASLQVSVPSVPKLVVSDGSGDLTDPTKKDIAMQLVSSAENSSLDWKAQYAYLEDIGDGRGYTGGIIGFTSGTHDMLELVQYYTKLQPGNPLAAFIPALQKVDGSQSHAGLGAAFEAAWKTAAGDPLFRQAQNDERDRVYFNPAVNQAKSDGLQALGQFIYYDALVMHGPGDDASSFGGIRSAAMKKAKTPAQGGDESVYLHAFLDAREAAMKTESAHEDTSRVSTEQRQFLQAGNLTLRTPLSWKVYGDSFSIQ